MSLADYIREKPVINTPRLRLRPLRPAFRAAARDRSQIAPLAHLLQSLGRFAEYEDRFYSIVKSWQT